jgi:hypothetical protein
VYNYSNHHDIDLLKFVQMSLLLGRHSLADYMELRVHSVAIRQLIETRSNKSTCLALNLSPEGQRIGKLGLNLSDKIDSSADVHLNIRS